MVYVIAYFDLSGWQRLQPRATDKFHVSYVSIFALIRVCSRRLFMWHQTTRLGSHQPLCVGPCWHVRHHPRAQAHMAQRDARQNVPFLAKSASVWERCRREKNSFLPAAPCVGQSESLRGKADAPLIPTQAAAAVRTGTLVCCWSRICVDGRASRRRAPVTVFTRAGAKSHSVRRGEWILLWALVFVDQIWVWDPAFSTFEAL